MKLDKKVNSKKERVISMPISQAEIKTLQSLSNVALPNIAEIFTPYQNTFSLLNDYIAEIKSPALRIADLYKDHFESMRKIQEQLLVPSLIINEIFKPLVESSKVFESLALAQANIARQLAGLVIDLPLVGYFKSLSASASFELTLDKFTSVKTLPTDYILTGKAVETIQHEYVSLKVSAGFEMRLSTIEIKLDHNNSKLDYLIEKDERREVLMEELIKYVKTTGSSLARIKSINYNQSSTEITIDNMQIKIRANTNQSDICRVLLSSKKSMQKVWEMEDITEALGETNSHKNLHRAIYDAVSELNTKILVETKGDIPDFFITTMKSIVVNPKYVS